MRILSVAGARPNFVKIAPILHEIHRHPDLDSLLVHTGQHYDMQMSEAFFRELEIPEPDAHLRVGSGSHAVQTANIMLAFEPVLDHARPDVVLVVGDVNSTVACALVAVKKGVPVAHVEAGLRSRDRTMPEEINRLVTDAISDILLTPSSDADANLLAEGIPPERIRRVGNVMIDSLHHEQSRAAAPPFWEKEDLQNVPYLLITMHRPANVDSAETLARFVDIFDTVRKDFRIVWPLHPRTKNRLVEFGLLKRLSRMPGMILADPLPYRQAIYLMSRAAAVLTDSGGVQEETTALGVPCFTTRPNTERPITVTEGTNTLVGSDREAILRGLADVQEGKSKRGRVPPLWDGKTASRIVEALREMVPHVKR